MLILRLLAQILTEPLQLAALLLLLALLSQMSMRRRACGALVTAAGVIVYLSSIPAVADRLLGPLERQYPSLPAAGPGRPIQYIVVLGSSYTPVPGWSVVGELDDDGLARIVDGVRLQRALNISTIVVSGGAADGTAPAAHGYATMARSLGVDAAAIKLLDQPKNTREEAKAVAALLGARPFILVTSAYHMPRAVRLMLEQGARPIPAPTGQRIVPDTRWHLRDVLPTPGALANTERALHEYLGTLALNAGLE